MQKHTLHPAVFLLLLQRLPVPQERHWKRAAACALAREAAAASRRSMLKHTAAIDAELQSCQNKVAAQLISQTGLPESQIVMHGKKSDLITVALHMPGSPQAKKCTCFFSDC